jgi:hypothetical protein
MFFFLIKNNNNIDMYERTAKTILLPTDKKYDRNFSCDKERGG